MRILSALAGVLRLLPSVIIAVALGLAAYYGTALYNFFIPTVAIGRNFSLGVVTLSIIGGAAAFLSPCAFGLLPAYFAFYLSSDAGSRTQSARRAVTYGICAAAGMLTTALLLAGLILVFGRSFAPSMRVVTPVPNPYTHGIRLAIAGLLVVIGILQVSGRSPLAPLLGRTHAMAARTVGRLRSPYPAFYLYGLVFVLFAAPCTANVMAAPLLFALATGGSSAAAVAFVLFSLTMATLMVAVSLLIGVLRETVLRAMASSTPHVLRAAGAITLFVGLTLVYYNLNLADFRDTFFHFPIR